MSTGLTIGGAVFEVVGLAVVFIELAMIRSHEFGVPTPWARLEAWVRRLLRRPQIIELEGLVHSRALGSAVVRKRPGALPDEPTLEDRLARLERYADCLDEDIDNLYRRVDLKADEVISEARRADDRLREEIHRREEERRTALQPSLRRQAFGAACVLVGLVFGTIGQVG